MLRSSFFYGCYTEDGHWLSSFFSWRKTKILKKVLGFLTPKDPLRTIIDMQGFFDKPSYYRRRVVV